MMPACTGPTGTWNTPSPVTGRNGWKSPATRGTALSAGKSLRSAHAPSGQSSWSATRAGFGWPSGTRPKKSMTSRSNQFAAGCCRRDRRIRGRGRIDRRRDSAGTSASRGSDQTWCSDESGRRRPARRSRRATAAARPGRGDADRRAPAAPPRRSRARARPDAARGRPAPAAPERRCDTSSHGRRHASPPHDVRRRTDQRHQRPGQVERRTRPPERRRRSCRARAEVEALRVSGMRRSAGSRGGPSTSRPT